MTSFFRVSVQIPPNLIKLLAIGPSYLFTLITMFLALTAADLKPRGGLQIGFPLKPSFPYSGANNYRGNPKRPNNTPASPTASPNKQVGRGPLHLQ